MQNKEIIIIALVILVVYLYYQQTQTKNLPLPPESQEVAELKKQLTNVQTLYQRRVEKDLDAGKFQRELEQKKGELQTKDKEYQELKKELTNLEKNNSNLNEELELTLEHSRVYKEKVSSLEDQLISLAKQKIKGKKNAEILLNDLESNWKKDKESLLEQIRTFNLTQDKLQKEKDNLVLELENSQETNQKLLEQIKRQKEDLNNSLRKEQEKYETLKLEKITNEKKAKDLVKGLETKLGVRKKENIQLQKQVREATAEARKVQGELDEKTKKLEKDLSYFSNLDQVQKKKIKDLETEQAGLKEQVKEVREKNKTLISQQDELTKKVKFFEDTESERVAELTEWKEKQQEKLWDMDKKLKKAKRETEFREKIFELYEEKPSDLESLYNMLSHKKGWWGVKYKQQGTSEENVRSVYAAQPGSECEKRYFCNDCKGIDWENCPNCKNG